MNKNNSWKDIQLEGIESHGDSGGGYWCDTLRNLYTIFEEDMCLPFYRYDQGITLYDEMFNITITNDFLIYSKIHKDYKKYKEDIEKHVFVWFVFMHKLYEHGYKILFHRTESNNERYYHIQNITDDNTKINCALVKLKYKCLEDNYYHLKVEDIDNNFKIEFFYHNNEEIEDELKISVLKGLSRRV